MSTLLCVGCGKDVTSDSKNRCNPSSEHCKEAVEMWKRLLYRERPELQDCADGLLACCRLCRHCFSVLQRLKKLEDSACSNMKDALSSLLDSGLIPDISTAEEPQRKKRCYSRSSTLTSSTKSKLNTD